MDVTGDWLIIASPTFSSVLIIVRCFKFYLYGYASRPLWKKLCGLIEEPRILRYQISSYECVCKLLKILSWLSVQLWFGSMLLTGEAAGVVSPDVPSYEPKPLPADLMICGSSAEG